MGENILVDTKIIFVGNYKGGVGKTTSVLNFAHYFTQAKKKVLVLDLDPQSSLSEILVGNNSGGVELSTLDETKTLNFVFDLHISRIKKYKRLELKFDKKIIQKYEKGKFDFIASSLFYNDGIGLDELAVRMEDNVEYLSILKRFLEPVLEKGEYDFILIDCPPSDNLITRSAFLLSDLYIIPTILDRTSTNGVTHYIRTVRQTYKKYCKDSEDSVLFKHFFGAEPKLIGIFCTFIRGQVNYERARQDLKEQVEQKCGIKDVYFFENIINNFIDIARRTEAGDVSSERNDYEVLSRLVLKRISEINPE